MKSDAKYKHKSGSQKRKQKEKLDKDRNKLAKIRHFFKRIPKGDIEIEREQDGSSSSLASTKASTSPNISGEGGNMEESEVDTNMEECRVEENVEES